MEFDVKIKSGDLYDYMMKHTYSKPAGLLGSTVGAIMILAGLAKAYVLFIILGAVLLLYLPYTLFIKSKRQSLNPVFQNPLHYVVDEEGITVSQGPVKEAVKWDDIYKAISTTKSIIVYTSKVNAWIFPKRDLGDQTVGLIQMISTHMDASRIKIRQ